LACAEDIPVLSQVCPLCKSAQNVPQPAPMAPMTPPPPPGPLSAGGPIGAERNIVMILVLWFFTCGIYGLVATYQAGSDLNAHRRRSDLNPGLDILLGILTCGVWFVYVLYRYADVLKEISTEEGGPVQDVTTPCLVLQICKYVGCPGIISLLVLQNEMNNHWRRHYGQG